MRSIGELRSWARTELVPSAAQAYPGTDPESVATLEADILVAHVLGVTRERILAQTNEQVSEAAARKISELVMRRQAQEPIAYIIGKKFFYSVELTVDRRVLIPRPETELLVERALSFLQGANDDYVVVDLCTGSGCIVLALMHEVRENLGEAHLARGKWIATDVSADALAVARENSQRLGLDAHVEFIESNLFEALPNEFESALQVFLSNPPYVRDNEVLPTSVEGFEPRRALRAGPEGLDVIRPLLKELSQRFTPETLALIEIGHDQRHALESVLRENGLVKFRFLTDLAGKDRAVEILGQQKKISQ